MSEQTEAPMPRLAWLLIASTTANVLTAGAVIYLALSTITVRVDGGWLTANVSASRNEPMPVRILGGDLIPVEVRGTVSVQTGYKDVLDVRIAR
jgi:hypothetical protein